MLGSDIWRCSIDPKDVTSLRIKNPFWEDVLKSWSMYNYYVDRREENSLIWYNSRIKIQGSLVMWNDSYERGLKYVHQLFSHGEFKSQDQMTQEFGLTVLRYNSLKSAIPKEYKLFFKERTAGTFLPIPPSNFDKAVTIYQKSLSKKVYKFIGEDVMIIHNKYLKWRQDIGPDFDMGLVDFGSLHKDIYKLTNVPKYRSFHYRLLQRGLVTNIQLEKWGLKPSELCTFCGKEKETLTHMFYQCEIVSDLWRQVF